MVKKKFIFMIVLTIFILVLNILNIKAMVISVRPKLNNETLIPNSNFDYIFNFTSDNSCSNVLYTHHEVIRTDNNGVGFSSEINFDGISTTPAYLCEYRDNSLRKIHNFSDFILRNIYVLGNVNADVVNASEVITPFIKTEEISSETGTTELSTNLDGGGYAEIIYLDNLSTNDLSVTGETLVNGIESNIGSIETAEDKKVFHGSVIWNNSEVIFETFKYEITRIGYHSLSKAFNILIDGSPVFWLDYEGSIFGEKTLNITGDGYFGDDVDIGDEVSVDTIRPHGSSVSIPFGYGTLIFTDGGIRSSSGYITFVTNQIFANGKLWFNNLTIESDKINSATGWINITSNLSVINGYSGTCINTTFIGGIAKSCND